MEVRENMTKQWKSEPNEQCILVAEDEETDVMLLRIAFQRAGLPIPLVVVSDGEEVIEYLKGEGRHSNQAHPMPSLLLLDLKMPRMTGFEVLTWLSENSQFKALPAIVLSSSSYDSDIKQARQLGARDYCVKPESLSGMVGLVRNLHARWLESAKGLDANPV